MKFEHIKFRKTDDFELIIDRLMEFERDTLESYPHLRNEVKHQERVGEEEGEIDDHFLKRHIKLFKYMTFQLCFDRETRSVSRIAKIRQYANDLKAISDVFDVDLFVRNEKKIHEYCKILRDVCDAARNESSSTSSSSALGAYNRGPPAKKMKS